MSCPISSKVQIHHLLVPSEPDFVSSLESSPTYEMLGFLLVCHMPLLIGVHDFLGGGLIVCPMSLAQDAIARSGWIWAKPDIIDDDEKARTVMHCNIDCMA